MKADAKMILALRRIARGRTDNGRPLSTEDSRQLGRTALIGAGLDWADGPVTKPKGSQS